ncbi:MAG: hypothetical protein EHM35_00350 [Planctomycetaceae bacterium]|nr:MAG: hypothetical protein EHM35_00350 [Planctomycetaceae bacterium]
MDNITKLSRSLQLAAYGALTGLSLGALAYLLTVRTLGAALLALLPWGIGYALLLEWSEREWNFVSDFTWLTVIIGDSLVLVALGIARPEWALWFAAGFAVAGTPVVLRSLLNDSANRRELRRELEGRGRSDDNPS